MKNLNNKSIYISAVLATTLGLGIFGETAVQVQVNATEAITAQSKALDDNEEKGVYRNWIEYRSSVTYGSTSDVKSFPVYVNYMLDGTAGDRWYTMGLVFPEYSFGTAIVLEDIFEEAYYDEDIATKTITFYDLDRMPEDGWTEEGADAATHNNPDDEYNYVSTVVGDKYEGYIPEEEWPFSLTAVDLYSETGSRYAATTEYNPWQHLLFKFPVTDEYYDHYFATSSDDTDALYSWNNSKFTADTMHTESNFVMARFGIGGYASNSGGLKSGSLSISLDDRETEDVDESYAKLNERYESLWLKYPQPEMTIGNSEVIKSTEDGHQGQYQVVGGSFQDGYDIDLQYNHTPTNIDYSQVDSIEYTLYGPTEKDSGDLEAVWDHYFITDENIQRQYRLDAESPAMSDVEVVATNGVDSSPWLDGTNDIEGGTYTGIPSSNSIDEMNGDINIAANEMLEFTPSNPGDEAATNYTTAWLHSNSEYKVEVKVRGIETPEGSSNTFDWPWLIEEDYLALEGWLQTEEYVASKPIIETFTNTSLSDTHEDNGSIIASFDYSLDTKADEEFDGSLESPSYISKIEIVDINDSEQKVYASQDITEDMFDETGHYSGDITTNDLPANSNLSLALRITYGKGDGSYASTDVVETYVDEAITIDTGSRGLADKEITNIVQTTETITDVISHTASTTVDVTINDIYQIEDGYTAETIPTITGGSTAALDHYDSSNINYVKIFDSQNDTEYGVTTTPAESNGIITVNVDGLPVNRDTDIYAEVGYNDDYGVQQVAKSSEITVSAESVGAFPPDVQSFILEQPILDDSTRKYKINGSAIIDIAPTTDADGNGYDGEGDYSPSNVSSIEIWEKSKTDAAVLVIDEIDNTQTLLNLDFTIGDDSYDIPAKSDLSFELIVKYDDGKTTTSKSNQNIEVGSRGDITVEGLNFNSEESRTLSNPIGPKMNLAWTLDADTFGYNTDDFNNFNITIEAEDTYLPYDSNNPDWASGDYITESIASTTFDSELLSLNADGKISGNLEFGSVDANPETTHSFKLKAQVEGEEEWLYADSTLDYEQGGIIAGAYEPQIVDLKLEEQEMVIKENPEESRDSITISFNVDQLNEPNEQGFMPSGVKSIVLNANELNDSNDVVSTEVITIYDGVEPLADTDDGIITGPDGDNYFEVTYDNMLPNRNYSFEIVSTYDKYVENTGSGDPLIAEGTYDTTTTLTTTSEIIGYEDFALEDMEKIEAKRTATTMNISYAIENKSYEESLKYFADYNLSTVKIVNVKDDGTVETLASNNASENFIQVKDIPVGYDISQGNLEFQIYTNEATFSYTDELAITNHTVVTDGSEYLANSQVIDAEWLESFDNIPDPDPLEDIITGTYSKPVFGEMKVDQGSVNANGFEFEIEIEDESSLIDFEQPMFIENDGEKFDLEFVENTKTNSKTEHGTFGTGTYKLRVSGLSDNSTYGVNWKIDYSIYDIEANVISTASEELISDSIITTTWSSARTGSVVAISILSVVILILGLLLLLWFLFRTKWVVTKTTDIKKGQVTLVTNKKTENVESIIKDRTLSVNGKQITYKTSTSDKGLLLITLTGIENGIKFNKLLLSADSEKVKSQTAELNKSSGDYESLLVKYNSDLAAWKEAGTKAKEEGKEFKKEAPIKPSKPAKITIDKDITIFGMINTTIKEEKKPKEKSAKNEKAITSKKEKSDIWTKDELQAKTKAELVEIAVATGMKKTDATSKTKPQLITSLNNKKK